MPHSSKYLDNEIKYFLQNNLYKKYLDIGVGAGKYGKMIREINPTSHIEGVEIEKDYIKEFSLNHIYSKIYNTDINHFIDTETNYTCDICIMGDCIEHLRKSDGIDLLNYLIYRSKFIIVKYPHKYIQYSVNGYDSEEHRLVWTKNDLKTFDYQYKEEYFIRLVIVKGYLYEK